MKPKTNADVIAAELQKTLYPNMSIEEIKRKLYLLTKETK